MSSLTPAMERLLHTGPVFSGPDLWGSKSAKSVEDKEKKSGAHSVTAVMLRTMINDSLAKQMHRTAVFLAERLVHLGSASTADVVLFARCYFEGGEYRRCLAFLEHRGLLSADMLRSVVDVFSPMGNKENAATTAAATDFSGDTSFRNTTPVMGVLNAETRMDRISAVQLAAHCLLALEEYEDCLVLLDPLVSLEDSAEAEAEADTDLGGVGGGRLHPPTAGEDRLVERAKSIFAAVSRSWGSTKDKSGASCGGGGGGALELEDRGCCTINVIAGLYATAGRCLDILDNRPRAIKAFTMALRIDAACTEVVDYIASRGLLNARERRRLLDIVVADQFSHTASSSGGTAARQWLLPYYQFMLGDATPESAMHGMHRSPEAQLNDSVAEGAEGNVDASGASDVAGNGHRGVGAGTGGIDVALGEGSAWLVRRAEFALDRQLTEDANRLARAAYTIDPFDMRGLLVYITSMVELRLKTELFYLGHELVNTYPKQAVSWYAVGCYYWICDKYEAAQKYLQKATKLDRRMHSAWVALGHVLAAQEESEHAISAYRAACRLVPGDHRPLCYMGKELVRTNNLSLGLHILLLSLTICPNDPAVRNELGVAYMRQDKMQEAERHLRTAAVVVYSRGGQSTLMGHDHDSSLPHSSSAAASPAKPLRPKTPESMSHMSHASNGSVPSSHSSGRTAQQHTGEEDDGEGWGAAGGLGGGANASYVAQYSGRVAGIGGNDEIMSNYATCLRRMGHYREALTWYERCLALDPGCADTHAHIGFTLHVSGCFDEAIDSYHRALTIQPNNVFCADMLTRALSDLTTFGEVF